MAAGGHAVPLLHDVGSLWVVLTTSCDVCVAAAQLDGRNYVIKEIDMTRMPKAERDASEQEAKVRRRCRVHQGGASTLHTMASLPQPCRRAGAHHAGVPLE